MFRFDLFRIRVFADVNFASPFSPIARGGLMLMLIMRFPRIWLPLIGYSFSETPVWAGICILLLMGSLSRWDP
jgi:hypothetical protein